METTELGVDLLQDEGRGEVTSSLGLSCPMLLLADAVRRECFDLVVGVDRQDFGRANQAHHGRHIGLRRGRRQQIEGPR